MDQRNNQFPVNNAYNTPNGVQGGYQTPIKKDNNRIQIILMIICAVLIAIILAIVFMRTCKDKEPIKPEPQQEKKQVKKDKEPTNRIFTVKGVDFTMVYIKGGSFTMGTNGGEFPRENPAHDVTISDFYIGETEVTQALWQAVMGNNPSYFRNKNRPVECVDYYDCTSFIQKLNELTGEQFRLPYEAEWEFASKGGTKSNGYKYSGSNIIDEVAWYNANSGNQTHDVASKLANELGIYDMSGNVWGWCEDWFDENYYKYSPSTNPTGPSDGYSWLNKGGGWKSGAKYCRSAYRGEGNEGETESFLGLRLAL